MRLSTLNLAALSPEDRDEIVRFMEFLQAVGPRKAPEYPARLQQWIEEQPEERSRYLGISIGHRMRAPEGDGDKAAAHDA